MGVVTTLLERAARMLFIPDFLHMRLTGEKSVEATIASTSQMIDPRTGKWATDLTTELGIPPHLLGPIAPPATALGKLLPSVIEAVGPGAESLQVVGPTTHDTAAAVALLVPSLLYFCASVLVPENPADVESWTAYYESIRVRYFGGLALWLEQAPSSGQLRTWPP